jgi:hydroxymethylpyrimidine pyrophosphatase-like HAD family hydrolase
MAAAASLLHVRPAVVALDLDGTTLDADHKLAPATAAALRRASKHLRIVFATGRPTWDVQPFVDALGAPVTCILFNGACAATLRPHTAPVTRFLEPLGGERAAEAYRAAIECGGAVSLVLPTRSVGVATNAKQRAQLAALDRKAGSAQDVVADGAPYVCEAIKVLALSDDPAATANDVRRRLHDGLDVVEAEIHVEFVAQGVDKATALRRVIGDEMLRTATVAIGDGHNDAAMLRAAHVGVATANATEAAKTAADAVSAWTNEDACVARELDALLALPPRSHLRRWRDAYAEERRKYAAAHPGAANRWLHALLSPIEWVAFLAVLRTWSRAAVWALQACVCLGTAAARPPYTLRLAPPQLLMAADVGLPAVYAAATWVAMIALQVGVGHGLLDRTAPSAAAEPVAPQSVLLNVCITWDF